MDLMETRENMIWMEFVQDWI